MRADPDFEEFFHAVFDRACVAGRRILGREDEAEDVAAEALSRAWARWARVRGLEYADAWVLRVAINLALKRARRARRAPSLEPSEPIKVEDFVVVRVTLVEAMRRLPRRQREAVGLRYLAGFTEDEVARSMGVAAGSVKTHLHRGLASLRQKLQTERT